MEKQKQFTQYQIGQRVRLEKMDDVSAPPIGTVGTIVNINNLGDWCQLSVRWENGSRLMVSLPEDVVKILK